MDKVCLTNDNFNKLLDLSLRNCVSNQKNDTISNPNNSIKFKPHSFVQLSSPNCNQNQYIHNGTCTDCPRVNKMPSFGSPDKTYCILPPPFSNDKYFDAQSGEFKDCPKGTYKGILNFSSNTCLKCPSEYMTGTGFCCPSGSKLSDNKQYCIKNQPIGGEVFNAVLNSFIKCPDGSVYPIDATDNTCKPCSNGYYPSEDQASCICEAPYVLNEDGKCTITPESKISYLVRSYGVPESLNSFVTSSIIAMIPNDQLTTFAMFFDPVSAAIKGRKINSNEVKQIIDLNNSDRDKTLLLASRFGIDAVAIAKATGASVETILTVIYYFFKIFEIICEIIGC